MATGTEEVCNSASSPHYHCKSAAATSYLHIVGLSHLVQQLKGLLFQHVIRILQAVNDGQLVLCCVLGVDAHNARQAVNAHILQVVAAALQERGNHLSSCGRTGIAFGIPRSAFVSHCQGVVFSTRFKLARCSSIWPLH